jgi:hypothetical protein
MGRWWYFWTFFVTFGICILCTFGIFCGNLVYIFPSWNVVPRKIWQPRSKFSRLNFQARQWTLNFQDWSVRPPGDIMSQTNINIIIPILTNVKIHTLDSILVSFWPFFSFSQHVLVTLPDSKGMKL